MGGKHIKYIVNNYNWILNIMDNYKNRAEKNQNSMIYGTSNGPKYTSLPAQVRDPITGKLSFETRQTIGEAIK